MSELVNCVSLHDPLTLLLAGAICLASQWAAFALLQQAKAHPNAHVGWPIAATATSAVGAWSTHFIAVLGYSQFTSLSFSDVETALSLLVVCASSTFWVASTNTNNSLTSCMIAGTAAAAGIAAMHFIGIAGVVFAGVIGYNYSLVGIYAFVGLALWIAALCAFIRLSEHIKWLFAGTLSALGILTIHLGAISAQRIEYAAPTAFGISAFSVNTIITVIVGLVTLAVTITLVVIVAAEKVAEWQAAAARADSAAKTSLLASVSHELRTPLNGIIGILELLKNKNSATAHTAPDEEALELIDTALTSSHGLAELIDSVLDLSRLDQAGKSVLRPYDLNALVTGTTKMLEYMALRRGLKIDIQAPSVTVELSTGLVRQVLINLVGNAIKFSDRGTISIRVAARQIVTDSATFRFEVADEGSGMSKDTLERLFMPYVQGEETGNARRNGTGLGLSISKKIVTDLRGIMGAKSTIGRGTTVWFELPLKTVSANTIAYPIIDAPSIVAPQMADTPSARALRVLVVDDNKVNRLVASGILKKLGAEVDTADDGFMALEKSKNRKFDIILMDIAMPGMSGDEAARQIRNHNTLYHAPIIVAFSANSSSADRASAQSAGMDDFITKPATKDQLRMLLQRWNNQKTAEQNCGTL